MKSSKSLTFCILSLGMSFLTSYVSTEETESLSSNASVRHKEPQGIGYHQGYSTVEVFGAPRQLRKLNFLPFIDARLHIFNDGNPAVNAGGGLRLINVNYN